MALEDEPGIARGHVRVDRSSPIRVHDLDQWLTVAVPPAPHGLDQVDISSLPGSFSQHLPDRLGTVGNPTRSQADPDLDSAVGRTGHASASVASSSSQALVGVNRPATCSSTIITGARLQQPRQFTDSRVKRRRRSVSASGGISSRRRISSMMCPTPATWQAVP